MAGRLLIGTRKGVFWLKADEERSNWTLEGPHYLGHVAQHVVQDPRDRNRVIVGARTGHLGPTVFYTDDFGETWNEATRPPAFRSGEELGRSLDAVFWLTPGHESQPGRWYAGGSPQGLFVSDDGGDTWETVDGWNDHPMWTTWCSWPEAQTPDGSMLHSINVDPRDPDHLLLGLSLGGAFESTDGGKDWHPLNKNVEATFLADPDQEWGHDPHCMRMHPANPDRIYQQNHCGIYRLDRTGNLETDRWERIGDNMPDHIGDIGFPIELDPADPDRAWVFPMDGTDVWPRTSPGGKPAVYRTLDGGESWTELTDGLPEQGWPTVLRQAMTTDGAASDELGVYFGTTNGEVWGSIDAGETWSCLAARLPRIFSVEWAS